MEWFPNSVRLRRRDNVSGLESSPILFWKGKDQLKATILAGDETVMNTLSQVDIGFKGSAKYEGSWVFHG